MTPQFKKRHTQPLDDDSYPHIARRLERIVHDLRSTDPLIRDRALTDLIHFVARLRQRKPGGVYCERCELSVTPRVDRGDSLCPNCGLVL